VHSVSRFVGKVGSLSSINNTSLVLFLSDAVTERLPGEMTLYVVPPQTMVPWLPRAGSAFAGAAKRTKVAATVMVMNTASDRAKALTSLSFFRRVTISARLSLGQDGQERLRLGCHVVVPETETPARRH
jgi:hypothetical protein